MSLLLMQNHVTAREALKMTFEALEESGISSGRQEAELLVCSVLGCDRTELFLELDRSLSHDEKELLVAYICRRKQRMPLQYVLGKANFRYLNIAVDRSALIPRPETELLVEAALEELGSLDSPLIIDIGTGSGAIALSMAHELPGSRVIAVDICSNALRLTSRNAADLGLEKCIDPVKSDLFKNLSADLRGRVDAIISNPPYIMSEDIKHLSPEVKDFEPAIALDGGRDGLCLIREIIRRSPRFLRPGGLLAIEVGWGQAERVCEIMTAIARYDHIEVKKDYSGIDRIITARARS